VIWLHGLGADGYDFDPVVPALGLPADLPVRFVFPHAPVRPVTINAGVRMRAWYDVRSLQASRDQDEAGIRASMDAVRALIERERERGVPASNVALAGFSQGGAIALLVGLRYPERLAALVALSTYLLFPERLAGEASAAGRSLPVFMAHGMQDPVVPFPLGQASAEKLRSLGQPLTWRSYPMPHAVCAEEIADIGRFLALHLGRGPGEPAQ